MYVKQLRDSYDFYYYAGTACFSNLFWRFCNIFSMRSPGYCLPRCLAIRQAGRTSITLITKASEKAAETRCTHMLLTQWLP